MKRILLNTLSFALLGIGYSQTVFTKQLLETYGDTTVVFGITNIAEVNIGNAGSNQTWDFSNVTLSDPQFSARIPFSTTLPHANQFAGANYASGALNIDAEGNISIDKETIGYSFIGDTKYQLMGTASTMYQSGYAIDRVEKYSPFQDVMKLPFSYNDVLNYTTNSSTTKSVSTGEDLGTETKNGTGTYTYEGYGKVTMPGSSTQANCARFKRVENGKITQIIPAELGLDFITEIKTEIVQHDFITDNYEVLSSISTTYTSLSILASALGNDTLSNVTQTINSGIFERNIKKKEIQQIALGLNDDKFFSGIEVYPNPTAEQVSINNNLQVKSVEIISAEGMHTPIRDFSRSFSIDGAKGLYLVKVNLQNGASKSYKIVKN